MRAEFLSALQEGCGGSIPFDRFMQAALYHPEFGYYTKTVRTVGARGDFSTWPSLDGSLASAVASWLGERPKRHVIEVGAGTGRLAADVLRGLGWWRRCRTTLHIVEISPVLRAQQERQLRGHRVRWHAGMAEALCACAGDADIYSNELPDAFPCRVFVRTEDSWSELAVRVEGGSARETLRPAALPASSSFEGNSPVGTRVEVHESYRDWLRAWAGGWKSGRMLTVDYGHEMPALSRRPRGGSVRAYAHQLRLTGAEVYSSFGKRDITADVNFSDLRAWGEDLGWETVSCASLADWMPSTSLAPSLREAGRAFRVLVQAASKS